MIPAQIQDDNPNLMGERMVFNWFSSSTVQGFVLHSLTQKNHKAKLVAEVDFLYISKRGLLCVEIKGGKSIYRESGEWFSISRTDKIYRIKDPFNQAKGCMYALQDYLADVYIKFPDQGKIIIGYAVVFPECIFTGKGNDLFTEIMFDCSNNMDEFSTFLESTFDFWEQNIVNKLGYKPKPLTNIQMNKLLDLLRGDFSVVPSMSLEMQHVERQLLILTEEQFDALETINLNRRVIVIGGAGTGKTLLAIEKARRTLAENKSVAFICFNKNIATVIKKNLNANESTCYVGTYHGLISNYLKMNFTAWSEADTLADLFLKSACEAYEYDCLIVDEAQDLMFLNVWDSLSKFLKGGMDKGQWTLFLDPNQNMFNTTEIYNFALDYLKEAYIPAVIPLMLNCRNTEQIGRLTSQVTKIPQVKHMKATGPEAVIQPVTSQKELLKMLKREISALLSGGCSPVDIIILSKYRIENSMLAGVKSICNLPLHYAEDIANLLPYSLNYFTIQSFKGLESNIIFLIDINGFEELKNRIRNYVAMTRAKIILFAFYNTEAQEEYTKINN